MAGLIAWPNALLPAKGPRAVLVFCKGPLKPAAVRRLNPGPHRRLHRRNTDKIPTLYRRWVFHILLGLTGRDVAHGLKRAERSINRLRALTRPARSPIRPHRQGPGFVRGLVVARKGILNGHLRGPSYHSRHRDDGQQNGRQTTWHSSRINRRRRASVGWY